MILNNFEIALLAKRLWQCTGGMYFSRVALVFTLSQIVFDDLLQSTPAMPDTGAADPVFEGGRDEENCSSRTLTQHLGDH